MEQQNVTTALYIVIGKKTVQLEALSSTVKLLQEANAKLEKELKELKENGNRLNKES